MKNFLTQLYLVGVMCFSILAAETINAGVSSAPLNEQFNRAELLVASELGEWTVYLGYLIDVKPQDAPRFSRLTDFLDRIEQGRADLSQPANSLHNLWAKKNAVAAIKAIHLANKKLTEADLSKNIKMRQFVFKKLDALFAQLIANKKNYSADFYKELLVQRRISARLLNHLTALEFIRFHKVFHPSVYLRITKNLIVSGVILGAAVGSLLIARSGLAANKMVHLHDAIINSATTNEEAAANFFDTNMAGLIRLKAKHPAIAQGISLFHVIDARVVAAIRALQTEGLSLVPVPKNELNENREIRTARVARIETVVAALKEMYPVSAIAANFAQAQQLGREGFLATVNNNLGATALAAGVVTGGALALASAAPALAAGAATTGLFYGAMRSLRGWGLLPQPAPAYGPATRQPGKACYR